MSQRRTYVGLHNDRYGGMTDVGRIILDAWVFEIIPEGETCEGWDYGRLEDLYQRVSAAWEPYAHLPSHLPPQLRERHERIYEAALERARAHGWPPDLEDDD